GAGSVRVGGPDPGFGGFGFDHRTKTGEFEFLDDLLERLLAGDRRAWLRGEGHDAPDVLQRYLGVRGRHGGRTSFRAPTPQLRGLAGGCSKTCAGVENRRPRWGGGQSRGGVDTMASARR